MPANPSIIITQVDGSGVSPEFATERHVIEHIPFATPENSIDFAVPAKLTPTGENGQNVALKPGQEPALGDRSIVPSKLPVPSSPLNTETLPAELTEHS